MSLTAALVLHFVFSHYWKTTTLQATFYASLTLSPLLKAILCHRNLVFRKRSKAILALTTLLAANYHSLKYDQKEIICGKSKIITSICMFPQSTTTKKSPRVFGIEILHAHSF
uniref:Uncharacterized protein n=1 Tax=Glossina austeni TaxID=7395 RepID=A0A1A9UWR3_GLOAU